MKKWLPLLSVVLCIFVTGLLIPVDKVEAHGNPADIVSTSQADQDDLLPLLSSLINPLSNAQPKQTSTFSVNPDEDAVLKSASGRISLQIPKGATSKAVDIEIKEYAASPAVGMLNLFELNAFAVDTREKITSFGKDIILTIKHEPGDLAGLDERTLGLYYLNEKTGLNENTGEWVPLSSGKYNLHSKNFSASVNHFSYFGEQAMPEIIGPGRVMAHQVNLHSGDFSFTYPIEVPAGPGGFQPKVELVYNSGSVNEMKNKKDVGSWVGIGWSLSLGKITFSKATGQYFLDLPNGSYGLYYSDDEDKYRTIPESHFVIERTGQTWQCWGSDGTYYEFGGTTETQQYDEDFEETYYYRWDLNLIRDANGNEATIYYDQHVVTEEFYDAERFTYVDLEFVRNAHPLSLVYEGFQVVFNTTGSRLDVPQGSKIYDDICLNSIEVKAGSTLIRKYSFAYTTTLFTYSGDYGGTYYSGRHTLTSITQKGTDGSSPLPAMSFAYTNKTISRTVSEELSYTGNPGNPASITWPFLSGIDSGYGGSVSVSYTVVGSTGNWYRARVSSKTVNPGIGTSETYSYSYLNSHYYGAGWDQKWRGYERVTESDAQDNYIRHYFYTTGLAADGKDSEKLTGKEHKTEWYTSEDELIKQKTYDWEVILTDDDLENISLWGTIGLVPGAIGRSYGVAVSSDGYVYLTDHGLIDEDEDGEWERTQIERVQKFRENGEFITAWGESSQLSGGLVYPSAISDDGGWVVDKDHNRVVLFSSDGEVIRSIGNGKTAAEKLNGPEGVFVYGGAVYVADTGNNCIKKFTAWNGAYVATWGSPGSGQGQFNAPTGLCVGNIMNNDYLYIADTGNNRIQIFRLSTGLFYSAWGTPGSADGQLNSPNGLFCDSTVYNGPVYVCDTGNNRIQKFSYSGSYQAKWTGFSAPENVVVDDGFLFVADTGNNQVVELTESGTTLATWGSSSKGTFDCPRDIAVTHDGCNSYVYVVDSNHHFIHKISVFMTQWGSTGSDLGEFSAASGLARDSQGRIWAVDTGNNRLQRFSSTGGSAASFGSYGTGNGQFNSPLGVAIDSNDNVYVVDSGNNRVQKFNSSGAYVTKWGSYGTGNGQFDSPIGIAIDSSNNVYVVDTGNLRIQKFDSSGNYTTQWTDVEFTEPWGIAVAGSYLYVTDPADDRMHKFTLSGTDSGVWTVSNPHYLSYSDGKLYITTYDLDGEGQVCLYQSSTFLKLWGDEPGEFLGDEMEFVFPQGIAVTSDGVVYVLDQLYEGGRIQVFASKYVESLSIDNTIQIGKPGGLALFGMPYGIAVDSSGNVYVVEKEVCQVQKFDSSGNFITKWGSYGTGDGQLDSPRGIAVDSSGYVYVADTGNNRIQKFTSSGSFVAKVGSLGSGSGQFNCPSDVGVRSTDSTYLYVSDRNNHRVQRFELDLDYVSTYNLGYATEGISAESGTFYVAMHDNDSGWVKKYSTRDFAFGDPTSDVAVSLEGIYVTVVDDDNPDTIYDDDNPPNDKVFKITTNHKILLEAEETIEGTKTSRVEYIYDNYGNVAAEFQMGDTSISTDDSTIWRVYYPNTSAGKNILGKLAEERVYAGTALTDDPLTYDLVKETHYFFDGYNLDNQLSTPPIKGNLTRVRQRANETEWVDKYVEYDLFGNKVKDTDANGKEITISWDSTYNSYPLTVNYDPTGLNFTESYTWDAGTSNQLTYTDFNSQTTTYQYDMWKRLTKIFKPGDDPINNPNNPSLKFLYNSWGTITQQNLETQSKISDGNFLWQKQYFDGLGRVVQVHAQGETGYTVVASSTLFNSRGLKDKEYVSQVYLSSALSGYKAPEAGWKYTSYTYEALGRVAAQSNADGSVISHVYTPWQETVTNALGFETDYYYDASGKLIQVKEHEDTSSFIYNGAFGNGPGTGDGYFDNPRGMAAYSTSYYFIVDSGNNRVQRFTQAGAYSSKWGTPGSAVGQFTNPTGAAIYGSYVFIVDTGNHRIQRFTTSGSGGVAYGTQGTGNGQYSSPTDIATGGSYLFVTDSGNNRVQRITSGGAYSTKWGSYGTGDGQFNNPTGIASNGTSVYVVDSGNNRVQRFSTSGAFQQKWGMPGSGKGEFNNPTDITIDSQGYVYVVDSGNNRVQKFDGDGWFISEWGTSGTGSGEFASPWGAFVDASGIVHVVDSGNDRIQKFSWQESANTFTTDYSYDVLGNLTGITDNQDNATSIEYDWLSRKISMDDPDMGAWTYGYDDNGNLTSQTDAKDQTITLVYDALNRLTNKNYEQGSGMTDVVYTYDATSGGNLGKGKRTGMVDEAGTNVYKFDNRGRLIEEKKTIDSVLYTTSFTYDHLDRIVTITLPTGETVNNAYNGRGLPSTLSGSLAGNLVTSTLYNQLGQITQLNFGNTLRTSFSYWGLDTTGGYYGRLYRIQTLPQAGGTDLQNIRHTWDAAGNLTLRIDEAASTAECFYYDSLDRLTSVAGSYDQEFTYDSIGNITSITKNATTYDYTYGSKPHAVTGVDAASYTYDANGNMTDRDGQAVTWDVENRPTDISNESYVYDGDGNRIIKSVGTDTYIYVNKYYEKKISAVTTITTSYYLGDRLIAQREGTTLRYVHQDHLSGTSVMSDSSGALISGVKFSAFGETLSGSVPTDKLFTGQRKDGTGLYYYGARYYDPGIGRFISADTASPNLSNPQSLNKYSYCFNNPLKFNDPTGHWPNLASIWKSTTKAVSAGVNFVKAHADLIQTALGIIGMIPIIGDVVDIASGLVSLMTGDYAGAALSLMCAIPIVGSVAGAGKIAKSATTLFLGKMSNKIDDLSHLGKLFNKGTALADLKFTTKTLNHELDRHGKALFGLGNWSKGTEAAFKDAIMSHIRKADGIFVDTWNKQDVLVYFDSATHIAVRTDLDGNFLTVWELSLDEFNQMINWGENVY